MKFLLLQIALIFAGPAFAAVPPSVSMKVESESRFVYEPFTLRVEVVSLSDPERPVIADSADYTVSAVSDGRRLSYSRGDTTTFIAEILATRPGVITIAPAVVMIDGQTLKSTPLRLTVDEPRPAAGMDLGVMFSSTNLYVGEALEMTVRWRSEIPFVQYQELLFELPILREAGLGVYAMEPDVPEKQRMCLPVNDQRVIAEKFSDAKGEGLCFRYMLVCREAGSFGAGRIHLSCALMKDKQNSNQYPSYFNNNFFSVPQPGSRFERVYQTAPVEGLRVTPLPESGRTPLFCGIAGTPEVAASISPQEVTVGDPMMLEVVFTNLAFGGQLAALPHAALEMIGPSFKLTQEPIREETMPCARRFVFAIRALRCDLSHVPALAFQVFDPQEREYRMLRTNPLAITVKPDGDRRIYAGAETGQNDPVVPLNGIRGNRKENRMLMNIYDLLGFAGRHAWLFWLGAPVLWLCIRGRVRHVERCRTDPAYARAAHALRRFRRSAGQDEEAALRRYLADRFGLCAEAITAESCAGELAERGVSSDLIEKTRGYFHSVDAGKYAPPGGNGVDTRGEASMIAAALDRGVALLVLLCFLWPLFSSAATPDAVFEAAMAIRDERPDEARPLFISAALGYQEQSAFFNAGNCWFFAGESGHALSAFLAAESLAPFDRDVAGSITFIRAQRPEGFALKGGTAGGIPALWRKICRWDFQQRLGILTLLYCGAWYVYLLYRVFGWLPGRRLRNGYFLVMAATALTLLASLFMPERGVVVRGAQARLGPGYGYGAAYEGLLPSTVEFDWLEREKDWVKIRMPDGNKAWIHNSACVKVPL